MRKIDLGLCFAEDFEKDLLVACCCSDYNYDNKITGADGGRVSAS